MKATVYGDVRKSPKTIKLWEGNLSMLPRPDDYINLHDDFGAYIVRSVLIDAPNDEAEIKVWINEGEELPPTADQAVATL